ncbi:MAG: 6-bladed beta-propeller [Marinilabiliaceae bacterium]|jgi:hypothetical protein|nr:6-bladed beta-propeller [Marinilabiliaceae bacterium]
MTKVFISTLLALLFLSSCSNEGKDDLKIIKVEKDKLVDLDLSDISVDVKAIILETSDSCLLSHIMKVEQSDSFLFVFDFSGPKVLQFSSDGSYIKKIGNKGRGPGEYPNLRTFALDKLNKQICIATSKKLMAYSYTGAFLKEVGHNFLVEDMTYTDDGLKILTTGFGAREESGTYVHTKYLYTLNRDLVFTDSLLVSKSYFDGNRGADHPMPFLISDIEDGLYIYAPEFLYEPFLRDTLFKLIDNTLIPYTKYDFGAGKEMNDPRKSIYIKNIYKSMRYSFMEFSYKRTAYFNVHDKISNNTWNLEEGITDDIFNTGAVTLRPLEEKSDLFFFTKDAYSLQGIIDGIHEDDNPVLFIVKLKYTYEDQL